MSTDHAKPTKKPPTHKSCQVVDDPSVPGGNFIVCEGDLGELSAEEYVVYMAQRQLKHRSIKERRLLAEIKSNIIRSKGSH